MTPKSSNACKLALLAEDQTDVDAFRVLVRRIARDAGLAAPTVKAQSTGGCGKLRCKADSLVKRLMGKGCNAVILVHDLDQNNEAKLRAELCKKLHGLCSDFLLCLPAETIEAWLWVDQRILDDIARNKVLKASPSPHRIKDPKRLLTNASRDAGNRPLYSTAANAKHMEVLDLQLCAKVCPAFAQLKEFIERRL